MRTEGIAVTIPHFILLRLVLLKDLRMRIAFDLVLVSKAN